MYNTKGKQSVKYECNQLHDTHVYPGCLATIFFKIPHLITVPVTAELSDDSSATAEVEQVAPDEVFVRIDAYTTARGTRIPENTWRLRYDNAQDIWKVIAKL